MGSNHQPVIYDDIFSPERTVSPGDCASAAGSAGWCGCAGPGARCHALEPRSCVESEGKRVRPLWVKHIKNYGKSPCLSGWWFGTFFIYPYIGNNHLNWLIYFRGFETTSQLCCIDCMHSHTHWQQYPRDDGCMFPCHCIRCGKWWI